MNVAANVKALNLKKGSFVVVGGSSLCALGIRESNDIDLIVSKDVFKKLQQQDWAPAHWGDLPALRRDVYDVTTACNGWSLEDILEDAFWVDGVPFMSLARLSIWKKQLGRDKDIKDIVLIGRYLTKS